MVGIENDLPGVGDELAVRIAGTLVHHAPGLHGAVAERGKFPVIAVVRGLGNVVKNQGFLTQIHAGPDLLGAYGPLAEPVAGFPAEGIGIRGPGIIDAVGSVAQAVPIQEARVDRHIGVALIRLAVFQEDVPESGHIGEDAHGHGVKVRQGFPVVGGVDHIHTILRGRDQTLEEQARHKAPLRDQRRVVVRIEDSQHLVGGLVVRMLGGVVVVEDKTVPVVEAGIGHGVDKSGGVEGVQGIFIPLAEHEGLAAHNSDGGKAQERGGHGARAKLDSERIRADVFRRAVDHIGVVLHWQDRMVEVGVVFHQIAVGVTVDVRRAGHQIAGHNGDLYAQLTEIGFEGLIKAAVDFSAELHEVGVAGRAFLGVPLAHRLIDRLVKAALDAAHALRRILVLAQGANAVQRPGFFQFLTAPVLFQQEVPEAAGYFIPIRLHVLALIRAGVAFDGRFLVVHLHGDDCRIVLEA